MTSTTTTTTSGPTTPAALKAIAIELIDCMFPPNQDYERMRALRSDDMTSIHADMPAAVGSDAVQERWENAQKFLLDPRHEVIDAIAEVDQAAGAGGKVWLFSRLTWHTPDGQSVGCDSVDMMIIRADGKVTRNKDVQRVGAPGQL